MVESILVLFIQTGDKIKKRKFSNQDKNEVNKTLMTNLNEFKFHFEYQALNKSDTSLADKTYSKELTLLEILIKIQSDL